MPFQSSWKDSKSPLDHRVVEIAIKAYALGGRHFSTAVPNILKENPCTAHVEKGNVGGTAATGNGVEVEGEIAAGIPHTDYAVST